MQLRNKPRQKKKREKIQQQMKMESIFKLSPKQELRPHNFNKCWLPEKQLSNKRFNQMQLEWQPNPPCLLNQLNRKKMMDIQKQLRKQKLKWKQLKRQWKKVLQIQIGKQLNKIKKQKACLISVHQPICMIHYQIWVK